MSDRDDKKIFESYIESPASTTGGSYIARLLRAAKFKRGKQDRASSSEDKGFNSDDQREKDEREVERVMALQKFGHGADYNTPFEETDHSKDEPALAPGDKRMSDGSVVDKTGKVVYKPKPKVAKEKKKPDGDGDGVPDWADKHHGEDDHEKKKMAKEGTKGTKTDREKADINDNEKLEPWEKARANAIRKSQGKTHLCAKTVNHESFGPGATIHGQHAIPDVNGDIEWYMVEFKHGTEKVRTEDVEVIFAVEHHHD